MGDLQTVGIGTARLGGRLGRGVGLSRPGRDRHGWVTSRPLGSGTARLGGRLGRGVVLSSGVGISFKPWPWGGSLVGGGEVLWLYRSENTTPASPSHHRINHHRASTESPKGRKSKERRESREKREQMRRRERNFRKK
jgi:hypothetical protein